MPERCSRCGKEFANTKALGSHLHYRHGHDKQNPMTEHVDRSESEKRRFRYLLEKCLLDTGLKLPRGIERIERALTEIPRGISPALEQYRDVFNRALSKEKLLREVEDLLRQEEAE
ncbi:hypothetical protein ACFLYR_01550 [Chloroflexota bacterium]